ncbi:unnamed protein product [Arabidopsis halleri]
MIRIFRGLEFQIWALHPEFEDTTLGCLSKSFFFAHHNSFWFCYLILPMMIKTIILADFSEVFIIYDLNCYTH